MQLRIYVGSSSLCGRNDKALNGKTFCWEQAKGRILKYLCEFINVKEGHSSGISKEVISWTPPPHNVLKLNTDASWNPDLNREEIGWILRDHSGNIIQAGHKSIDFHWSVDYLEALAIL